MTPAEAKEFLPIISAYAEGKTIQTKRADGSGWIDAREPLYFNEQPSYYRIKPAPCPPSRVYLATYEDGSVTQCTHETGLPMFSPISRSPRTGVFQYTIAGQLP